MRGSSIFVLSLLALALAPSAWADSDKHHGHGRGQAELAFAPPARVIVTEHDRAAVYSYYRGEFVGGQCPPGLARKEIGCLPPGLAQRVWTVGAPLPPSVAFYPLPDVLLARLTPAPQGYQYVRIDNDIVLISTGPRIAVQSVGSLANLQDPGLPLVAQPDREAIAAYYRSEYRAGNCPDGLMRTDSGCAAKPLWALDAPLDPSVTYQLLPDPLLAQLGPAPDGTQYIRLGQHVLLLVVETRVIRVDLLDLDRIAVVSAPVASTSVAAPAAVVVPERVDVIGGGCPPGLAKKHNGCLPPGHAR
jgi:hypothetical protein